MEYFTGTQSRHCRNRSRRINPRRCKFHPRIHLFTPQSPISCLGSPSSYLAIVIWFFEGVMSRSQSVAAPSIRPDPLFAPIFRYQKRTNHRLRTALPAFQLLCHSSYNISLDRNRSFRKQ
jgi:hypothetical protein